MGEKRGTMVTYVGEGVFSTGSRNVTIVRMYNRDDETRYYLFTDWMSQAGDTRLGPESGFKTLKDARKYITEHNLRGMSVSEWRRRRRTGAAGEYDETHKVQRGETDEAPALRSLGMEWGQDDGEVFDTI